MSRVLITSQSKGKGAAKGPEGTLGGDGSLTVTVAMVSQVCGSVQTLTLRTSAVSSSSYVSDASVTLSLRKHHQPKSHTD